MRSSNTSLLQCAIVIGALLASPAAGIAKSTTGSNQSVDWGWPRERSAQDFCGLPAVDLTQREWRACPFGSSEHELEVRREHAVAAVFRRGGFHLLPWAADALVVEDSAVVALAGLGVDDDNSEPIYFFR